MRNGRFRLAMLAALAPLGSVAVAAGVAYAASRPRPDLPEAQMPIPPSRLPRARIEYVPGVGELFLRDSGGDPDRPVVLLLHGWMLDADVNWFTCYEPLSEIARVVALDHRGHGRGLRPSKPFRLVDAADDAAALLRHLGSPPVVAVGYSMGGAVAQLLWRRHPDLVRGMVLCATSAAFNVDARDRWTWRLMGVLQLGLRLVPRHWWERMLMRQAAGSRVRITRMLPSPAPVETAALIPWVMSELDRDSAEDVAEAGRELSRFDARGWIGSVDVPCGVLITTEDVLVPVRNQRDLARRVPTAMVQELPLDHDAVAAAPEQFVPALRKAIEQVVADGDSTGRPTL
ncbi:MAG: alpha/beta fold hydrolase [Nitriliruptorales bacterium]|nr:alpha/beta fold hydrolase [Nitriliruptorales bacterium]